MGDSLGAISGRIEIEYQEAVRGLERVRDAIRQLEASGGGKIPALTNAGNQIKALEDRADAFEKKWRGTGLALGGFGLAVAAGATAGTMAFVNFERGMANVNSIARLSQQELKAVSDEVLNLAAASGQGPTVLADALYDIYSSGFQGADALNILTAATNAANAGLTTTAVSGKAITAVLNAYGLSADQAGAVSDTLFKVVDQGVVSFEQLSNNLGSVLPIAAALGIPIEELGAGYAVLTKSGISVAETETALAAVMRSAINPTEALQAAVEEYGYSSAEALIQAEGLPGFLKVLETASGGTAEGLSDLLGSSEATTAALALMAENGNEYAAMLLEMQTASEGAGATQEALAEQSKSLGFQIDRLQSMFQVLAIRVGEATAPFVRFGVDALQGVLSGLLALPPGIQKAILAFVGIAGAVSGLVGGFLLAFPVFLRFQASILKLANIGRPLTAQITRMAPAFAALGRMILGVLNPIRLLSAAFRLLVGTNPILLALSLALLAFQTNFLGFGDAVRNVAGKIAGWLTPALEGVQNFVNSFLTSWHNLTDATKNFNIFGGVTGVTPGMAKLPAFFLALGNAIGKIGGGIPIFQKIGKAVTGFGNSLNTLTSTYKKLTKNGVRPVEAGLEALSRAFPALSGVIGQVSPYVSRFLNSFEALRRAGFDPVEAAISALAAAFPGLAGVVDNLISSWNHLKDALGSVRDAFAAVFEGDWSGALTALGDAANSVIAMIADNWRALGELARTVFDAIDWGAVGSRAASLIVAGLRGLADGAGAVMGALIDALESRFPALAGVFDGIASAFGAVSNAVQGVIDRIANVVGTAIDFATSEAAILAYQAIWDGLNSAVGRIVGAIATVAGYVFDFATSEAAIETYREIWNDLNSAIGRIVGAISTVAGYVFDFATSEAAIQTYRDLWDDLNTAIGRIVGAISTVAGYVFDFASSETAIRAYQELWRGLNTVIGGTLGVISTVAGYVFDFSTSETAIRIYQELWKGLQTVIGGTLGTIATVAGYVFDFATAESTVNGFKAVWDKLSGAVGAVIGVVSTVAGYTPTFSATSTVNGFKAVWDKLKTAIDAIVGAINGVAGVVPDFSSITGPIQGVIDLIGQATDAFTAFKNLLGGGGYEGNLPTSDYTVPSYPMDPKTDERGNTEPVDITEPTDPLIGPPVAFPAEGELKPNGIRAWTQAIAAARVQAVGLKADATTAFAGIKGAHDTNMVPVTNALAGTPITWATPVRAAMGGIKEAIGSNLLAASGIVTGRFTEMHGSASALSAAMSGSVKANAASMEAGTSASANAMSGRVRAAMSGMQSGSIASASGMRTGVTGASSGMSASVQGHAGAMRSGVAAQTSAMASSGIGNAQRMASGAVSAVQGATGGIRNAAGSWAGAVSGAAGAMRSAGNAAGAAAGDGLVAGLRGALGRVRGAAAELAAAAAGAMSGALKSASPSKVTMQIGNWAVDGFVLPMQRRLREVFGVASNLADAVRRGMSNPFGFAGAMTVPAYVAAGVPIAPTGGYLATPGGGTSITNNLSITQLPGENGEAFAARVVSMLKRDLGDI